MELFQLEAFLAVVREGSFSAAAKALFRTQPAISQTIKKLEDEIGRPLFDRSSRRAESCPKSIEPIARLPSRKPTDFRHWRKTGLNTSSLPAGIAIGERIRTEFN